MSENARSTPKVSEIVKLAELYKLDEAKAKTC